MLFGGEHDLFSPTSTQFQANKRQFIDLVDKDNEIADLHRKKITTMLEEGGVRLILDIDDLRAHDAELAAQVIKRPIQFIAPWQAGLKEFIKTLGEVNAATDPEADFRLGFDGNFGAHRVDPRKLKADHVGALMCVEGIVTRCSLVRPKMTKTVHYCPTTNIHSSQIFHDATSLTGFATGSAYPSKDADGNQLETEYGLSTYTDCQTVTIQEMPERAPPGLLPKSVDIIFELDLVDRCKPGDRVQVAGVYRALAGASQGETTGNFRTVLIANCIKELGKSQAQGTNYTEITEKDIKNIREFSRRKDMFEILASSIAPSIYGHAFIKKAVVLLLLGGCEKNLANGTHIRGDVNMLMIGDPSTAKSQILRFVLSLAPLAINTTGRGSSGVGLTAAVIQDPDTGERKLEAGAMVLADRGIVCIDEFDKMSDIDRVSIHEVMEQQTVTIAKAGIHMSLNARCSVVAAANPAYGQYDRSLTPSRNISMPDSLLSRFDLLFIVLDQPDPEIDRDISDRVISNHRFLAKHGDQVVAAQHKPDLESPMYQRYDKMLHGHAAKSHKELLTMPFLKKYLKFAKETYSPVLSEEAADYVSQAYKEFRSRQQSARALPITARALETMIRLSTAHAKARLSKKVTLADAEAAVGVMKFAMENDTQVIETKDADENGDDRKHNGHGEGKAPPTLPPPEGPRGDGLGAVALAPSPRFSPSALPAPSSPRNRSPRKRAREEYEEVPTPLALTEVPSGTLMEERVDVFQSAVLRLWTDRRVDEVSVDEAVAEANEHVNIAYSPEEVTLILRRLDHANRLMFDVEDMVVRQV